MYHVGIGDILHYISAREKLQSRTNIGMYHLGIVDILPYISATEKLAVP